MALLATFRKFLKRNDGATAIEYSLIAAGIALAIIPAVRLVGTNLTSSFQTVADAAASSNADCQSMGGAIGQDYCGGGGGGGNGGGLDDN